MIGYYIIMNGYAGNLEYLPASQICPLYRWLSWRLALLAAIWQRGWRHLYTWGRLLVQVPLLVVTNTLVATDLVTEDSLVDEFGVSIQAHP